MKDPNGMAWFSRRVHGEEAPTALAACEPALLHENGVPCLAGASPDERLSIP
jgi:hypothetical protein